MAYIKIEVEPSSSKITITLEVDQMAFDWAAAVAEVKEAQGVEASAQMLLDKVTALVVSLKQTAVDTGADPALVAQMEQSLSDLHATSTSLVAAVASDDATTGGSGNPTMPGGSSTLSGGASTVPGGASTAGGATTIAGGAVTPVGGASTGPGGADPGTGATPTPAPPPGTVGQAT